MTNGGVVGTSVAGSVWLLIHHHMDPSLTNGVDDKFIGFFTSPAGAVRAQSQVSRAEGFRDQPEGFEVVQVAVDVVLPEPGIRLQY